MSSSAAPISTSAEHVCIADEGSITVLASSSLRQTAAIPASSIVSLHLDASAIKSQPSIVTTLDVEGKFSTFPVGHSGANNRSGANNNTNSAGESFPAEMQLTSLSPNKGTATVLAASMSRPTGFSFSSGALGGKKPLVASALLSCGTVVHHNDVSASSTRKPKVLGRHPMMAQMSNLIFAASPTLPLVVIAQPGKRSLFVFSVDPATLDDDTVVVATNNSNTDAAEPTSNTSSKKQTSLNKKNKNTTNTDGNNKSDNEEGDSSSSDDDEDSVDLERELITIRANKRHADPSSFQHHLLPTVIHSPVAISTITLHPTRPCLAIGGVRGEVVVVHDIFNHQKSQSNSNNRLNRQQMFIDHWHHTPVSALAFGGGQDGSLLLSGASEGILCLWNIGSNYARTNISLGAGLTETNKITAIRVANDEPSKCFVCVGDGEIHLAAVDLSHRRLSAKRDGLTMAYSSHSSKFSRKQNLAEGNNQVVRELLLSAATPYAESNGATIVTEPINWLENGASTAVFLYQRNSGKIRLYDPFERRSLRSCVLTASVETVPHPPTVGLQFVAASADGKRVACFESSKEKIMPPVLRFLVYDSNLHRFRQVQQASDPHPGEGALIGAFWIKMMNNTENDINNNNKKPSRDAYCLVTVSKQRIKVWKPLNYSTLSNNVEEEDETIINNNDQELVASLLNPGAVATSNKNKKLAADDDQNFLMTCSSDLVFRYHPTLSLLGAAAHINSAAISADQSLLYVASDVVAAVDLQGLLRSSSTSSSKTSDVNAIIAVSKNNNNNSNNQIVDKKKSLVVSLSPSQQQNSGSTSTGVVAAYHNAISIFGIVSSGQLACRSVLFNEPQYTVLSVSSPFSSSADSTTTSDESNNSNTTNTNNNNEYIIALVAQETETADSIPSAKLYLIETNSCKIVAAAPWQAKYAPVSRRSLRVLSSVSEASSSSWRCTVGVATSTRGFRTLNVVLKGDLISSTAEDDKNISKKGGSKNNNNKTTAVDEDAELPLVSAAPVKTVDEDTATLNREKVASFFKQVHHDQAHSTASHNALATQRQFMVQTNEKIEKSKLAAKYGKEVLGETTFFATPSMSAVTASVFARLEGDENDDE